MDEKIIYFVRKANTTGCVIKHRNNIDVVFFATRGDETHHDDPRSPVVVFNGYWINVASQKPHIINSDIIYIKTGDIPNWEEVPDPRP